MQLKLHFRVEKQEFETNHRVKRTIPENKLLHQQVKLCANIPWKEDYLQKMRRKKNKNSQNWKESRIYFAPMESIVQMNGLLSSPNPAITGWQKYGPNLTQKKTCKQWLEPNNEIEQHEDRRKQTNIILRWIVIIFANIRFPDVLFCGFHDNITFTLYILCAFNDLWKKSLRITNPTFTSKSWVASM